MNFLSGLGDLCGSEALAKQYSKEPKIIDQPFMWRTAAKVSPLS